MNDVFQFGKNSAYELRSDNHLQRTNIQTLHFASESMKTLGAKVWGLIPAEIKTSKSLTIFKKNIKNWTPKGCLCRLCRIYIDQLVSEINIYFFAKSHHLINFVRPVIQDILYTYIFYFLSIL